MFAVNRKELMNTIYSMQRMRCEYDGYSINRNSQPPTSCDCKYGYNGSEQTGCPELRLVCSLLDVMTDEEYKLLIKRSNDILLDEIVESNKEKKKSKMSLKDKLIVRSLKKKIKQDNKEKINGRHYTTGNDGWIHPID
jgi:hypothetical protein